MSFVRPRPHVLLLVAVLLTGCTHTRAFDAHDEGLAAATVRAEINERAERSDAVVALTTGGNVAARSLHVAPDVTTWIDPRSGEARSAPSDAVVRIRFVRRGQGAVEGLGLGSAVGAGAGALVGYVLGRAFNSPERPPNARCNGPFCGDGELEAFVLGVLSGAAGGVVGTIGGTIRGSRFEYERPAHQQTP